MPIVTVPTFQDPVTGKEIPLGSQARGSIKKTRTYQMTTVTIDGDMDHRRRVQLQYPYHVPADPKTDLQIPERADFKAASAAWDLLSPEEKEVWNVKANLEYLNRHDNPGEYKVHNGRQLFIGYYRRLP